MFLTLDILKDYGACGRGVDWFVRYFPEGAELIDVINHKYVTPYFLHWGYNNLTTSAEEKEAYWKKLNIDCDNIYTIYSCDNIKNSEWISRSSRIEDSWYVFSSQDVASSEDVLCSSDVSDSKRVYGSEFVYSSNRVLNSKNVNNSHNIVGSDYVINSHSVMNSAAVTNSAFVDGWLPGGSKQIKDCRFVMECSNLKHSLFCHKINDGEYMIFNRQVDVADYELIVKQLDRMLKEYESILVKDNYWPSHVIPLDMPNVQRNIIKQYAELPSSFWRWVKTLPGYDPSILYAITYNKDLI